MKKFLANLGGVALGAAAALAAANGGTLPVDGAGWKSFGLALVLAILGNQIGLHQEKPAK